MNKNPYAEDEQLSLNFAEKLSKKVAAATTDKDGFPKDVIPLSKLPKVKVNGEWRHISYVAYEGYLDFFSSDFFPFPDNLYIDLEETGECIQIKKLSSLLKKYPNGHFKNVEYLVADKSGYEKEMVGNFIFSKAK